MAVLSKLKPGMIVYSVQRQRMGNTTMSRGCLFNVEIISVDHEDESVVASWNSNKPQRFFKNSWSKWKIKKPVAKREKFGLPDYS